MILTSLDRAIIRRLQEDFPLTETPYKDMANSLNITEDALLERIETYMNEGILRRVGAVVRHQKMGYRSNSMVVWQVPEDSIREAGSQMAAHPAVSHCYQRPSMPDFPYNLYTMIHGKKPGDCEEIVKELSEKTGIYVYLMLESLQELKKTSMKYFADEND